MKENDSNWRTDFRDIVSRQVSRREARQMAFAQVSGHKIQELGIGKGDDVRRVGLCMKLRTDGKTNGPRRERRARARAFVRANY